MNYKCYADNCYSNPVGYCSCNGVPTLFCLIHSHKHIKINRDHRIYDMAANPLSETHKNLLKISQFKISLKITQKTLLSESLELVKLIKNSN